MATSKSAGKKAGHRAADPVAVIGLAEIVAAGANGIYTSPEVHSSLLEAGLVEINTAMTNEAGEIATRATQAGIESLDKGNSNADNTNSQTAETGTTKKVKTMFQIKKGFSALNITIKGRGRGGKVYPFEQLEIDEYFFVANSEDKPNAVKSLASTVSCATARYAVGTGEFKTVKVKDYQTDEKGEKVKTADGKFVVIGEHDEQREVMRETRKFVVRSGEEDGVNGAFVTRVA